MLKAPRSMAKYDTVLVANGVYTLDGEVFKGIALREGNIVRLLTHDDIENASKDCSTFIEVKGYAFPAFTDTHVHLIELGMREDMLDLSNCKTKEEILDKLSFKVSSAKDGEWIIGRGWDQERLDSGEVPRLEELDRVSPKNPILLLRVCGHVALVNSLALSYSGVVKREFVERGEVDVDEEGRPTGLIKERALEKVRESVPEPSIERLVSYIEKASWKAARSGITCVHSIVRSKSGLDALLRASMEGRLPIKVLALVNHEVVSKMGDEEFSRYKGPNFRVLGVKVFVDGSLGARTAALSSDYSDDPGNRGMLIYDKAELEKIIKKFSERGLQVAIHAIGDKAVDIATRAIVANLKNGKNELRHRIEHASVVSPETLEEIRNNGILCSIQPRFAYSDYWVGQRLGNRFRWAYRFRTMLEMGIKMCASSDAPVEPIEPTEGIWAASEGHVNPEETITIKQAIEVYCKGGAYAGFEEGHRGSLRPGYKADIVVIDRDLVRCKPGEVRKSKVILVMREGKILHREPGMVKVKPS